MSRRSSRRPASIAGALLLLAVVGCRQLTAPPPTPTRTGSGGGGSNGSTRPSRPTGSSSSSNEGNLLLGNPSGANTDANNFLVQRPQYTLSFNHRNGGPNWVAWHTDESDLGSTSRGTFRPDPMLQNDWQITPSDYKGSGYDRGHVCPSGDRTNSRANNDATFYMSNMLPQTPELNQHIWADLENYARDQIRAGNEVYQVAGPSGTAGTIAGGAVVVPKLCWKVLVIMPLGTGDLRRINSQTRVIAVAIPNANDKRLETADWRSYVVTPRRIEDATHLDLFSGLPPQVKRALEQKTDSSG